MPARAVCAPRAGAGSPSARRMLRFRGMKPVLLLAVLALGPALAEQFPAPPHTAVVARNLVGPQSRITPPPPLTDADRRSLCGT